MVHGNLSQLKDIEISDLEKFYSASYGESDFLPEDLVHALAKATGIINKALCIYLDRKGFVVAVAVGEPSDFDLPGIISSSNKTLSGIRCFHSHPSEDCTLSDDDTNTLVKLRLDAIFVVGTKKQSYTHISAAIPTIDNNFNVYKADYFSPFRIGKKDFSVVFRLIKEIDSNLRDNPFRNKSEEKAEKALILSVVTATESHKSCEENQHTLSELKQLAIITGVEVIKEITYYADNDNFIGENKLKDLLLLCDSLSISLVIFNGDLTGVQIQNLEIGLKIKVIDNTALILGAFAKRVSSREGKIRAELAQLKHIFSHFNGDFLHIPSVNRGIGSNNPNDRKLLSDKKLIRLRMKSLAEDLADISQEQRKVKENRRKLPSITLVGYVGSGKSTLLETLTAEDKTNTDKSISKTNGFSKNLVLPNGLEVSLVDTLGFIHGLPSDLLEIYKFTLEEVAYSDLIIHVLDTSSKTVLQDYSSMNNLLQTLNIAHKPTIVVFNKIELNKEMSSVIEGHPLFKDLCAVAKISAKEGTHIEELLGMIVKLLYNSKKDFTSDSSNK